MEHMLLPVLHWSTGSSSRGASTTEEQGEQLCWSTWSSGSLGAYASAPVEHYGTAASLEHREQLCWSTRSRGSLGADTAAPLLHVLQQSCSLCSREAAAPSAPVEQLHLLTESRCSTCSSTAALCAPGKPLLHVLQ